MAVSSATGREGHRNVVLEGARPAGNSVEETRKQEPSSHFQRPSEEGPTAGTTDNRCGHGTLASSDHGSHRPDPGIKDTGRPSVISRETNINSRLRPIQEL